MACPWGAVDSAKIPRSRERGSVLSCGNTLGVSTYSLITGPCEVQSTDDIIHPLWPLGLGSLWGKWVREEGLEVRESGKTEKMGIRVLGTRTVAEGAPE